MTMHPHGIFYANEMDGAYKGKFTDPGGFVQRNRTFTYVWEAQEGTEGTWLYHDHGPMDPLPVFKGLFGPLRDPQAGRSAARPRVLPRLPHLGPLDHRPARASSTASTARPTPATRRPWKRRSASGSPSTSTASTTSSTPSTCTATAGPNRTGTIVDNKTFGPADSFRVEFTEDNPGRWFYHCHVFQHLHQGMNGWYLVS